MRNPIPIVLISAAALDRILRELRDRGVPVPRDVAIADLALLRDTGTLLGMNLVRRWGWLPDQVEALLSDAGATADVAIGVGHAEGLGAPKAEMAQSARVVYAHWRTYHPRALDEPLDDAMKSIRARLDNTAHAAKGNVDEAVRLCCVVIDWIHNAPDAAHWQGANRRGPAAEGKSYTGIGTIFAAQKWSDRLEAARAWDAAGRPKNERLAAQRYDLEAEKAWTYLCGLASKHRSPPESLHPEPSKATALREAIRVVGWTRVQRARPDEERAMRTQFIEAYCAARAGS